MDLTITYCVPCDYSEYALSVTRELLKNWQHEINQLVLITGSKGIFDVKVNRELLFSKKELDRYPEPCEISKLLKVKKKIRKMFEYTTFNKQTSKTKKVRRFGIKDIYLAYFGTCLFLSVYYRCFFLQLPKLLAKSLKPQIK